jgi:glycosyltransferase involved in cell wall biosynthesis
VKFNVLNISQSDRIVGGSDVYWLELAALLRNRGHSVSMFCASESDEKLPRAVDFDSPGVLDVFSFVYNLEAKRKIKGFFAGVDVAHLHIYYGKLTGSILSEIKKAGLPVVQTLHEYKVVCPVYTMHRGGENCYECAGNRFYKCLANRCNRGSYSRSLLSVVESYASLLSGSQSLVDKFITVSDYQKNQIVAMGMPEDKIITVHNFVNCDDYEPSGFVGEYLLYFGRVEKVKGIDVLIKAMSILKKNKRNVKLVIAGSGSYLEEAKQMVKDLRVTELISFVGHQSKDEIAKLLDGCFASVTPSVWAETFGLTLLESFAKERAVIASNIGGMTEIVKDGETGYLVAPGSDSELASKIDLLSSNLGVAKEMGRRARTVVKEKFSPESHYEKIMKVYESVIK